MPKEPSHFMIFAHPRSGSSQLRRIMIANGLSMIYEPFNQDIEVAKYYPILIEKGIEESLHLIQQEALGFKHIWEQVHYKENDFMLARVPTILLWRENTLDMAISYWVAHQTQVWNGVAVEYSKKFVLNPDRVSNYILRMAQDLNYYKRKATEAHHLTYEQLFGQDGLDHVSSALRFVGGNIIDLESTRQLLRLEMKQNQKPWSEVIENWNEIMAHLNHNNK